METNTSSTPSLNDSAGSAEFLNTSLPHVVEVVFLSVNAVVSLVGNGLSLAVFTRSRLRGTPSSGYLAALAVADTGSAIIAAVFSSAQVFRYAPMAVLCHALSFLDDVFLFLSAWFVVCFTGERYISIYHPLRAPDILARLRARYVTTFVTVLAAALYAYHLVPIRDLASYTTHGAFECEIQGDKELLEKVYFAFVYVTYMVAFVVPTLLVVVLNVLIVFQLRRNSRNRQLGVQGREAREDQSQGIARTLFLVSLAFFVCNFPLNTMVALAWAGFSFSDWVELICIILFNVSFSCNFFLYAMSGSKFRSSVKKLLRMRRETHSDSERTSREGQLGK